MTTEDTEGTEFAPCGAWGLSRKLFAKAHQAKASRRTEVKPSGRTQVTIGAAPMALVNRNIVIGSPYGLPF